MYITNRNNVFVMIIINLTNTIGVFVTHDLYY